MDGQSIPLVVYVDGARTVIGEAWVSGDGEVTCKPTTDFGKGLLNPSHNLSHFSISVTLEEPSFDKADEVAVIRPVPVRSIREDFTDSELQHIATFLRNYNCEL